jgi:hypothetical protein
MDQKNELKPLVPVTVKKYLSSLIIEDLNFIRKDTVKN